MAYNKCVLMGRLVRDPETRQTAGGTSVASFTLAVDRGFGDDKQTDYIPAVSFGKFADTIGKYVTKGTLILISGSLQTKSWEDKDGNKRTGFEVVATEFSFCETRRDSSTNSPSEYGSDSQAKSEPQLETVNEELPF